MLERARQIIREVLQQAQHPAVMLSGGKDSMLLLSLAREVKDVPCLWFRSGMTHEQERFTKRMIMEWNLDVWCWEPADVYVIPNDEGLSLIKEQAFGPHRFPVVVDIVEGERCIADVSTERTPQLYPHFTDILIGYKDTDYHWSLGGSGFCPPDGWMLGRAKMFAPLRHLSDAEVWKAIRELNVPVDEERYAGDEAKDGGQVSACTRCLQAGTDQVFCPKEQKEIGRIAWDAQESLSAFRQRFALGDN